MKFLYKILFTTLLLGPFSVFAATTVPWAITNLTDAYIFPNAVNGVTKGIILTASSTILKLTSISSTSTNATTTNFAITGSAANCNGTNALTTNSTGGVTCTAQPQGTVTAVSIASANGFAGSSGGGATPALTLSTTITGLLKGNGTAISAATAGTDYANFSWPFTPTTNFAAAAQATTGIAWFQNGLQSSSTITIGTGLANQPSVMQFGPSALAWIMGWDNSNNAYEISKGTTLGTNNALAIDPTSFKVTTTFGSSTAQTIATMYSTLASTTNLTINLPSCSGSNALTTSAAGVVACGAITASAGAFPFTPTTYGAQAVNATSTGIWLTAAGGIPYSLISSSTLSTMLMVGTSSLNYPIAALTVGTSTAPQVLLTDNLPSVPEFFMRAFNGSWWFGTTTANGLSTSTNPILAFTASTSPTGLLGVGTSSPKSALDVNGTIKSGEQYFGSATTSNMVIDWSASSTAQNQTIIQIGPAAQTVQFVNFYAGETKRLMICNPAQTAGAFTITYTYNGNTVSPLYSTAPAQTTTGKHCDMWSYFASVGTSTTGLVEIFGAQTPF